MRDRQIRFVLRIASRESVRDRFPVPRQLAALGHPLPVRVAATECVPTSDVPVLIQQPLPDPFFPRNPSTMTRKSQSGALSSIFTTLLHLSLLVSIAPVDLSSSSYASTTSKRVASSRYRLVDRVLIVIIVFPTPRATSAPFRTPSLVIVDPRSSRGTDPWIISVSRPRWIRVVAIQSDHAAAGEIARIFPSMYLLRAEGHARLQNKHIVSRGVRILRGVTLKVGGWTRGRRSSIHFAV